LACVSRAIEADGKVDFDDFEALFAGPAEEPVELPRVLQQPAAASAAAAPASRQRDEAVKHETCPNCGFRLALFKPPTEETAPFNVMHCPVCEMKFDDAGFRAGQMLKGGDRPAALRVWMARQGLSEENLQEVTGFKLDELFEESS